LLCSLAFERYPISGSLAVSPILESQREYSQIPICERFLQCAQTFIEACDDDALNVDLSLSGVIQFPTMRFEYSGQVIG